MTQHTAPSISTSPERTAILVIDMQNDFLDENGFSARLGRDLSGRRALIDRVNRFVVECRRHGARILFARVAFTEATASASYVARWGRWDVAVVEGSWGAELSNALVAPLPHEPVITKAGYDSFIGTNLDLLLRNAGVDTLVLCGVNTNVCVETTARHAHGLGYHVAVLADLCAAGSVAEHESALQNVSRYFGTVLTGDEVLRLWAAAGTLPDS